MRSFTSFLVAGVLGCAGLLATPADADAQIRFGIGRGYGYNRGYYPGYNYGNYGSGFGVTLPRLGLSIGTSPYYYGSSYYPYSYSRSYYPYSYSRSYYPYSYSRSYSVPYYSGGTTYYTPSYSYSSGPVYSTSAYRPATESAGVRIEAILPDPNADVWFDQHHSTVSGSPRVFIFSDNTADQKYRHTVKASWMQDGRMVTQEREVKVMGGEKAVVDFTKEKMPEPARSEDGKVPPVPREENP